MRSAADRSDLTARARIRDAAVARFAVEGFAVPVRAIAADAGVSPGLVLHHFGSKEGLRAECDEHVLELIRTSKRDVLAAESGPTSFLAEIATVADRAPLVGYVLRSLQAGGPVGRAFVEHMIQDAVEYLREGVAAGLIQPSRDEEARARYLTMSSLGALLAELALTPTATLDELTTVVTTYFGRIALPALELYTEGFLTTRRMLDDYLMYVPDPPGTPVADSGRDDNRE
ncbi:TetR/AcrR family transcriptional regulator [Antribacter gilvus]|uniref:TetR/AcrR family transcriptional regulator n=1 Tax=Antribacter gilvus TaxID=2304675 RepID=UPI000F7A045F|nr:TetR family transcriptional regulator [Antribacter gilvus]